MLIALVLFMTLFFVVNNFTNRIAAEREDVFGELLTRAYTVSYALTESKGEPIDWNFVNFTRPGVVSERNLIDGAKLLHFIAANQTRLKQALGIEDYSLRVRMLDSNDSLMRVGGWSDFGRIAYTQAGHELNYEGNCETGGLRCWLRESGMAFDEYNQTASSTDFFNLLGNLSNYETIVLEDTHIDRSDLNSTQRQQFQDWLSNGRTYIHKEHGDIFRLAGANDSDDMTGTPRIQTLGNMLFNASVGDTLSCDDEQTVNNTNQQQEMANLVKFITDSRNAAVLATWNYGSGRVFFLSDTECSVAGSKAHAHMRFVLTLFGVDAQTGSAPVNATAIAPAVSINSYRGNATKLEVTLWK